MQLNEFACIKKLEEIKKHAHEYQQKHLQERLDVARKRKDENTEKAIIRMLKREHDKKKYGKLRVGMGKQHGFPDAQIADPCETGPNQIFLEKIQIDEVAGSLLSERFGRAHHATLSLGKLLDDI